MINVDGLRADGAGGVTVSTYIADWLVRKEINRVFTLPGGMIASILDAIHLRGATSIVTLYHEQAAAFAADGLGRYTGRPSVAIATAGPGATNMLTPIASAFLDSVPAIFLCGQVQSYLMKGARQVRQFGFQECDVVAMAAPVTKAAWRAGSARELVAMLDDAFELATSGRPGPVLIEIPSDLQTLPVGVEELVAAGGGATAVAVTPPEPDKAVVDFIDELVDAVASAERPALLLGGGVQAARAAERTRAFVRALSAPTAASVMALDVLGGDDPLFMGMIGMYGNRWTNTLMTEADVVVALGTRLDFGTIGADVGAWGRGRRIFQVDCDAAEMKRLRGARTLQSDLGEFLDSALRRLGARTVLPKPSWAEHVSELRSRWPDTDELGGAPGINPNVLFNRASHWLSGSAATVVDAGQHLWWACQSYRPAAGQRFLPALGLGPCGWALPAAIGIASDVGRPVNLIAGDGAVQLNLQELQTLVRDQLPVRMIIVDNGAHGSVRQLQEAAFGGRYPTTVIGYSAPDFARVAQAYGIPARVLDDPGDIEDGLRWLRDAPDGPALLHVKIATELNVYPNVPFGRSLSEMEVLGSGVQPSH